MDGLTVSNDCFIIIRCSDIRSDFRARLNYIACWHNTIFAHQCNSYFCRGYSPTNARVFSNVDTLINDGAFNNGPACNLTVCQDDRFTHNCPGADDCAR